VADDEAAGVDGETVHGVAAEVELLEQTQSRVLTAGVDVLSAAKTAIQAARVERVDAHVRPRRAADGVLHERPRLVREKTFREQQDGLAARDLVEAVQ